MSSASKALWKTVAILLPLMGLAIFWFIGATVFCGIQTCSSRGETAAGLSGFLGLAIGIYAARSLWPSRYD